MAESSDPGPLVNEHSSVSCEKAKNPNKCDCDCHGAAHQSNVLLAAITAKSDPEDFDWLLTDTFGAKFTSLSQSPSLERPQRRGRSAWKNPAEAGKNKWRGQREQRIVDVTLRDLLALVYLLPKDAKTHWEEVAGALILRTGLKKFTNKIEKLNLKKNKQSAYFWASMLAALSESANHGSLKPFSGGAEAVDAATTSTVENDQVYTMQCKPRQSRAEWIIEVGHTKAVVAAVESIQPAAEKAHKHGMSQDEFTLLVQIVGSAVSSDLWHHPAAVRHLLAPAVTRLRGLAKQNGIDSAFSLDGDEPEGGLSPVQKDKGSLPVEDLIFEELGQKWRQRGHWGRRA